MRKSKERIFKPCKNPSSLNFPAWKYKTMLRHGVCIDLKLTLFLILTFVWEQQLSLQEKSMPGISRHSKCLCTTATKNWMENIEALAIITCGTRKWYGLSQDENPGYPHRGWYWFDRKGECTFLVDSVGLVWIPCNHFPTFGKKCYKRIHR